MHLFTDCPDQLPPEWIRKHRVDRHPSLNVLENALGQGIPMKSFVLPTSGVPDSTVLAVIGEAEGSQFDALLGAERESGRLPDRCIALAIEGRGFHGHRGRAWRARSGNIHLSACFHPGCAARDLGFGLTMLPAVAVMGMLEEVIGLDHGAGIKWVNDVLVGGHKLSGVISSSLIQGQKLETAVVGIGLNVETVPDLASTPFVPSASSMNQEWGRSFAWTDVAEPLCRVLLQRFDELMEKGPQALFEVYRRYSLIIGRRVRITREDQDQNADAEILAEGVVCDLLPDLSIRLEGQAERVTRGRLVFLD